MSVFQIQISAFLLQIILLHENRYLYLLLKKSVFKMQISAFNRFKSKQDAINMKLKVKPHLLDIANFNTKYFIPRNRWMPCGFKFVSTVLQSY